MSEVDSRSERDRGAWPTETLPASWCWVGFETAFSNETTSDRKLAQKEYAATGQLAVVDQGQSSIAGYTNDAGLRHPALPPVIVFGDHTRCVKFVDFAFVQGADGVKVLRPKDLFDARFAYHALRAVVLPDRGYARHFKFLTATAFPLPPLNEQRRIVAKLEALQARSRRAREALDAVPPLLEKLRQSILAAAFRGDLTADWRARNKNVEPASKLLERIRSERRKKWEESELAKLKAKGKAPTDDKWKSKYKEPVPVDTTGLPELPDGWCWASLDELTRVIDPNPSHRYPEYEGGTVPIVSTQEFVALNDWDATGAKLVQESFWRWQRDQCEFSTTDIIFARKGRLGLARRPPPLDAYVFSHTVFVIKCVEQIDSSFLLWMLRQSSVVAWLLREMNSNTGVPTLGKATMERLPIPLVPLSEQQAIVRAVESADRVAEVLSEQVVNLLPAAASLERALLAKAFRGELVPQDLNDEPAKVVASRMDGERGIGTAKRRLRRRSGTAKEYGIE